MIPIKNPIKKPALFDAECRDKGNAWLATNSTCERPRDFWSPFKNDLASGFKDRCAFGAMWISSGTVDHFVAFKVDATLTYEWDNYRYVEGWINSSKKKTSVLDPFIVKKGWFEIILPSMQLVCTTAIPKKYLALAQDTVKNLPLGNDERILRTRREWYRMYLDGEINLIALKKKAPLIADAILKNNITPKGSKNKAKSKP